MDGPSWVRGAANLAALLLYFVPTFVGWRRSRGASPGPAVPVGLLFVLNLLLGWTFFGWIAVLFLAFREPHQFVWGRGGGGPGDRAAVRLGGVPAPGDRAVPALRRARRDVPALPGHAGGVRVAHRGERDVHLGSLHLLRGKRARAVRSVRGRRLRLCFRGPGKGCLLYTSPSPRD